MELDSESVLRSRTSHFSVDDNCWRYGAGIAIGSVLWLFAWYRETALLTVSMWYESETFAHGFLIFPISSWMIWLRRRDVGALSPRPNFWVLGLIAAAGFAWLLANAADVLVLQQYCVVSMIPLMIAALLGLDIAVKLAFPLLFLLFAVPVGEFLLPPLMDYTADFTVLALQLTGIPVYREGLFFAIPSGNWSVVEACSGLRYLIASLTLGCLYAYLSYRSIKRRLFFVGLSVLVPVLANGLRAYMIVMIGHLTDMKLAAGVDHYIYGWIFFGVVMLLLFWAGSFWREDQPTERISKSSWREPTVSPSFSKLSAAAISVLVVVTVWPLYAMWLAERAPADAPKLTLSDPQNGWQAVPGRLTSWEPEYVGVRAKLNQTYAKDDRQIGLYIGYYNNQHQGIELINSLNTIVSSQNSAWGIIDSRDLMISIDAQELPIKETRLRSMDQRLLTWQLYWVEGHYATNRYVVKALQAVYKLLGRGDDAAVIIGYAVYDEEPQKAAHTVAEFLGEMFPAIAGALNHANQS